MVTYTPYATLLAMNLWELEAYSLEVIQVLEKRNAKNRG